ncbi:MAG: sulfopyruvate decarboxylase subunit beta [Candidatus Omnitrophica bacterium]|nr:sulfopyruvate decarboxylase subunit beta [Candidatus Omnitrophota bacterium]
MTTREAIGIVARELTDELVVCTTGYTCRDMQAAADRAANFYMIGSMGCAASIGLGMALSSPGRRVLVLDGDGALLMGLGVLPMVGTLKPRNLIHLVLDNGVFASTGNQPTYSRSVALDSLARAAGYSVLKRAETAEELKRGWGEVRSQAGPIFFLVKCRPDAGQPMERVRLSPEAITDRFREAVGVAH